MLPKELEQSECMMHARPAPGKVARLMLELLKNIEGDDDGLVQELTKTLVRTKLLIETSMLEAEPDFDALVHTPALMQGEPHATLPRVLAVVWMLATDPVTADTSGWCAIKKLTQYLMVASPTEIAARMRAIDPMITRARFILEDFMQTLSPVYMRRDTTMMDLMPKSGRHGNRPRYLPTRSTLLDDAISTSQDPRPTWADSSYDVKETREEVVTDTRQMPDIPKAPPIPEPIQMKPKTGSVVKHSNAGCVMSYSYVCLFMCVLIFLIVIIPEAFDDLVKEILK